MRQDLVSQGRMKRRGLGEIHAGSENFLEIRLYTEEVKESYWLVELHEKVNITTLAGFIASH
jgi:hypothetical protein